MIYSEIYFSQIVTGFALNYYFIFELKYDTNVLYELVKIKYHTSEYQIGGNIYRVVYDIHTYNWRNFD